MKTPLHTTKGFSLVEVLVYLAVTIFISTAGVLTYISLTTVLMRHQTERTVNHAAEVALERIGQAARAATSVNTAQSLLGVPGGRLTLTEGATTTQFSLTAGTLVLSQNGTEIGALTGSDVSVENFTVNHFYGTSTELVRVALTLHAENKAASTTRTYYTSTVLRGSYE